MITKFRGDHFFLSNMFPCEINYNGNVFGSSEAAYMSRKNNSKSWLSTCINTKNPILVKTMSHSIYIIKKWPEIKLQVMSDILRIKFSIPELQAKLFETGDEEIYEGNTWNDRYWGVDHLTLQGENHLGKLLMNIREQIKQGELK